MKTNNNRLHHLRATITNPNLRPFSAAPEAYTLRKFHWQLFVTLTFRIPYNSQSCSLPQVFSWLRTVAATCHIHFHRLLWVLRFEYETERIRGHYHLCLAGLPPVLLDGRFCRRLESLWWTGGGSLSEVTPYNRTRDGVGYILKLLRTDQVETVTTDRRVRTGENDCEPMLSDSLIQAVRRGRM